MAFENGHKLSHGGARRGAGRKPEEWKRIHDRALKAAVTEEDLEAVYASLLKEAKGGNVKAAGMVLERIAGKVEQAIVHQGDENKPISVKILKGVSMDDL